MLLSDIGPEVRSRVHKLLIEEEDKLGKDLQLLADIEGISRRARGGSKHCGPVCALCRRTVMMVSGRAQAFLDGMMETQQISMKYRQLVKKEIERNRLLDT
jgi:hypothetical protein